MVVASSPYTEGVDTSPAFKDERPGPLVRTSRGSVRGTSADGIDRFLGIPYAKPPFGEHRFAAPVAPDMWEGVRNADTFSATAPQSPYGGALGELLVSRTVEGEDVLSVNVWAPAGAASLPVVLWIHGGALERGSSAQSGYDGSTFARDGVVFVSLNYRLGVEGFSVLEGAPLNLGLLDAALALQWVHDEIAAFGGDPSRVTVMGESAGGALVAALLTRAESRALIAGAIVQSGPLEAAVPDKARRASDAIARKLRVNAHRDAFAALSSAALLEARAEIAAGSSPLGGTPGFALALDAMSLPEVPEDALVTVDVPLLIGTNTDEYRLWLTPEAVGKIGRVKAWLACRAMRIPRRAVKALRSAVPGLPAGEELGQLVTDRLLRAPASRLAGRRSARSYVYEFAWSSPVRDLRAAHAIEIAFAFDRVDDEDALRLSGSDAPEELAAQMHAAWVAFIRDGDPGWPAYGTKRMTRVWDTVTRDVPQRRAEVIDALS